MADEIDALARAHALFAGQPDGRGLPGAHSPGTDGMRQSGATAAAYRDAAAARVVALSDAHAVDDEFARAVTVARRDHDVARRDTAAVLAAARADAGKAGNPVAARELLHRRVIRLRAQQNHVLSARQRSRRRRADLRGLRYRLDGSGAAGGGPRVRAAVRAALSRLGRPYVWGATGPDRFDCSGLVQWAYAQAGIPLQRTTYQQIHQGVPVSPSQVRAGDLVFPHTGHVQLAIGNNLVVEAPQPGSSVQISRMGPSVAIRRVA
jgi:cell wall-associated NlpC family hydrolase